MDHLTQRGAPPNEPADRRNISIQSDRDGQSAVVTVRAGPAAGAAELRDALESAGVIAGIDPATFNRLALGLVDPAFEISNEPIAQAIPAQPGQAGRFESAFEVGLQPGHVREDGTVDFHDRELLKPVQAGDVLGRLWPACPGVTGRLVNGAAIEPAKVSEAKLTLGGGAERDALGVIRAKRSGVVICKTADSVDVIDRHVHEGDVDLHTGHLHMQGSLLVKGDVHNTFGVYASGDVEIRGSVDNGCVYAAGDVWIRRSVRGAAGSVCAEGNLVVQRAESASLAAGKLLQVGEALHATLSAGRVEVAGKLRGGVASAEFSAVVREAGSSQASSTEIAVAQPLELPVEAARRHLERSKVAHGKMPSPRDARHGPAERGKGGKSGRVQAALQDAETRRLAQRARRRDELCAVAFAEVHLAHAGVTIRVGDHKLLLEENTSACRFTLDGETRRIVGAKIRP